VDRLQEEIARPPEHLAIDFFIWSDTWMLAAAFARTFRVLVKTDSCMPWDMKKFREESELQGLARGHRAFSLCREKDPWWQFVDKLVRAPRLSPKIPTCLPPDLSLHQLVSQFKSNVLGRVRRSKFAFRFLQGKNHRSTLRSHIACQMQ